jgi:hypothetical protein
MVLCSDVGHETSPFNLAIYIEGHYGSRRDACCHSFVKGYGLTSPHPTRVLRYATAALVSGVTGYATRDVVDHFIRQRGTGWRGFAIVAFGKELRQEVIELRHRK